MYGYIVRRLFAVILTLFFVSASIFSILHIIPGDPAAIVAGPSASPAQIQKIRDHLGLNKPVWKRYLDWINGAVRGHLGRSISYSVPVSGMIGNRLLVTLPLAAFSSLLSLVFALPLGVYAAAHQDSVVDWLITSTVQLGLAIPTFWMGLMLIALFAVDLNLFPAGGFTAWSESPLRALQSLVLPAFALGLIRAAELTRIVRSTVLDTLHAPYIQTARAKGISEIRILLKHVLANSFISVLTLIGLQVGRLIGGAIIVEEVFSLPGLGKLLLEAVWDRDFPVIQSGILVVSGFIVTTHFVIDLLYGILDPRMRYR